MRLTAHVRFGGGPSEKGQHTWHLAGGLPDPKKDGARRPLGLPAWTDKLVGEVVRLLLEAYYEPQFSARSHGFRTGRGCHTALDEIASTWTGTTWFIEGDIADCFGSLDHEVMLAILAEQIHDKRFLQLVKGMLRAGYLEDWTWHATYSGAPQGGVVSPILSNIYLDRLDTFVEQELVPAWTRGTVRRRSRVYGNVTARIRYWRSKGDRDKVKAFRRLQQAIPSVDVHDPDYRRLRYIRYADDHLLGFAGTKAEAEQIKDELTAFLRNNLKLELSTEKTLITHARTHKARFLGYDVWTRQADTWHTKGGRSLNGNIALGVPPEAVNARCRTYLREQSKPLIRNDLIRTSDYNIVAAFGTEYRGYVQYYQLAGNINWLNKLRGVMERSMMSTLAAKYRRPPWAMRRRYQATVVTPYGKRRCYEATQRTPSGAVFTARFGGIPLRRRKHARLIDGAWPTRRGTQLIARLTAGICELCDSRDGITVHHVKRLADLNRYSPTTAPSWVQAMRDSRRKTLIVCARCHDSIHQQPHTQ
jgi:group II intron reverse transcriptase/maturase